MNHFRICFLKSTHLKTDLNDQVSVLYQCGSLIIQKKPVHCMASVLATITLTTLIFLAN